MRKILIFLLLTIYPAASYADSLEGVINKVYEKGENKLEGLLQKNYLMGREILKFLLMQKKMANPNIAL